MRITTAEFEQTPKMYRKHAFMATLLSNIVAMLFIMGLTIGLICLGVFASLELALAMTVVFYLVMPFSMADQVTSKKYLLKYSARAFDRRRTFEFDDEGMTIRNESGSHSFTVWSDLLSATYKHGITKIFITREMAHLIPDTAWKSPGEGDQLRAMLRSKGLLKLK